MNTSLFPPVETPRLLLRCVSETDAPAVAALMTPAVSRWLAAWPIPFTVELAAARIEMMRKLALRRDAMPLAMIEKSTSALIGWLTDSREAADLASLGFWLSIAHHGRGYMREAVPAALTAGFAWLDVPVIEAGAQPDNVASLAIMRAAGMHPSGERMVYAAARARHELCLFHELRRPD